MAAPTQPTAPCRSCGQVWPDDVLTCPTDGSLLPLEGRLLGDKFRLVKRLGQGGMATVWQATHELIQRPVAIKLMLERYAADADLLARFRNEATAAGRIGSPHICDVLDFGRSPIGPYIVMELLSGCSLSDLIHAYKKLDAGLAVWILRQALDGLDAAHRAGIIHRDLKPENIFLCRAIRDQWLVKLMDFGISKFTDSLRTGAGTTMGSPNYMAPEQIRGAEAVDARADVWSCGAILYEAISGESPFARDSIADSLAAVRNFDPPPLHTRAPDVSPGLSEVVARALHKQTELRWPTARALADALAPFERRGTRMREPPPEPRGGDAPRSNTTMRKSGAAPRALLDADRPPSGPYPPVSSARSGDKPPSGPYPPVSSARSGDKPPSGPYPPVPPARGDRRSDVFPAVPSARPSPEPAARTGANPQVAQAPPGKPTGPHTSVNTARPGKPTGPHPSVNTARPGKPTGPHPSVSSASSNAEAAPPVRAPLQAVAALPLPQRAITSGGFKPVPRSIAARSPQPARSGDIPAQPQPAAPRPAKTPVRKRPANAAATPIRPRFDTRPLLLALLVAAIGSTIAMIAWFAL